MTAEASCLGAQGIYEAIILFLCKPDESTIAHEIQPLIHRIEM